VRVKAGRSGMHITQQLIGAVALTQIQSASLFTLLFSHRQNFHFLVFSVRMVVSCGFSSLFCGIFPPEIACGRGGMGSGIGGGR
jgi:hypothetical protein